VAATAAADEATADTKEEDTKPFFFLFSFLLSKILLMDFFLSYRKIIVMDFGLNVLPLPCILLNLEFIAFFSFTTHHGEQHVVNVVLARPEIQRRSSLSIV
jgi:hypothetical protein